MFRIFRKALWPSRNDALSQAFSSLGWLGFWMQIAIGLVPLALTIYALAFGRNPAPGTRAGLPLIEYLSIAGLFVLAFTALWSFRYTRLAIRLADPERRPTRAAVQKTVWTGVKASTFGIVLSMLVMLFEVIQLLIYFLRAPQAGIRSCRQQRGRELGIGSRHRRPFSPASHDVCGGYRSRIQPLAPVPHDAPVTRISSSRRLRRSIARKER